MEEKDNMRLWNKVCNTDKDFTKDFAIDGNALTAINAQYQTMKATEIWGEYGYLWGLRDLVYNFIKEKGSIIMVTLDAKFYYMTETGVTVEFPVSTDMPFRKHTGDLETDFRKKLLTDAKSKALSMLGFSADIYMGMWDSNKYLSDTEAIKPPPLKDEARKVMTKTMFESLYKLIQGGKIDDVRSTLKEYKKNSLTLSLEEKIKAKEKEERDEKKKPTVKAKK